MPRLVNPASVSAGFATNADMQTALGNLTTVLGRLPTLGLTAVQYGAITLTSVATATGTIAAVDTTKAIVLILGHTQTNAAAASEIPRVALTNATTVTATRIDTGVGTTVVRFVVLTLNGITSYQQGVATIASAGLTGTATITSVNTARAAIFYQGQDIAGGAGGTDISQFAHLTLTNATTITATRVSNATGATDVGFIIVEF